MIEADLLTGLGCFSKTDHFKFGEDSWAQEDTNTF